MNGLVQPPVARVAVVLLCCCVVVVADVVEWLYYLKE